MALVPFPGSRPEPGPEPDDEQSRRLGPFDSDDDDVAGKMSFLEHLDELRKRLINACIAIIIGVCATFYFHDKIYNFVFEPTRRVLPPGSKLMYTDPSEAFSLHLQIALITGVLVAAPYIMYQVWLFIAPGLYSHEKKFAIPFVLLSSSGFIAGALFNHYVVFPFMMAFFGSFMSPDLVFMPKLETVFSMYTKFLLAMGLIFQMPTIVFFLAKMRVVTARFLVKNFKYAFLIIFILAAVITPTGDPGTQTVFAAPMVLLYLLSILIAWLVAPRKPASAAND